MTKPSLIARCTLSEQCLPDAPYRAMLCKLHKDMLDEIDRLKAAQTAPARELDYWLGFGLQAHTEKPFEGATPVFTAAQPAAHQCHWIQMDNEHTPETWQGACGAVWTFTEGGPKDNDQAYCPKCGGVCIEVRADEKGQP
jgi:hypothetical protein